MAYNWQDQMTPPDLLGGGIDTEIDNDSLLAPIRSMQGNMPSGALMQMAMNQPQGNPFLEAMAGGAALVSGRPNPVALQNAQMNQQQNQMFQNVMKIQTEERQMAIAQANMSMQQRRQGEIERQNQLDNDHRKVVEDRLKDEQKFRKAEHTLTLANKFADSEDPITRKEAGPLYAEAYKDLGRPAPDALISSLISPKPPKKEDLHEAQSLINAGMDNEAVSRRLPNLTTAVLDDIREVMKQPGAPEKLGLKSDKDMKLRDLQIDAAVAKNWEQKYGLTEPRLGAAAARQLNKMGIEPNKATDAEVSRAVDLAQAAINAEDFKKESQRAQISLDKSKELATFTAGLKADKPMSLVDVQRLGKQIDPIAANLEITTKIKEALAKIPDDAFPTGDTWLDLQAASLRRGFKYAGNEEWRVFSTYIIPKLIGFDRGTLDDLGNKSIKSFGPIFGIIEGGGVPSKKTIQAITSIVDEAEKRKANAIFSRLVSMGQPDDVLGWVRDQLGSALDPALIRKSGQPYSPPGAVPIQQSPLSPISPRLRWNVEKGEWE